MKKILLTTLLTILVVPVTSFAVSFDCTKAASLTEKLICGDKKTSKLDDQLASAYKQALESSTDKDAIKKTQIEWLKQQKVCKDADCLMHVYQARIAELNENSGQPRVSSFSSTALVDDGSKKPLTFKLVYGDSYPICQPYVDMLNKTKYTEYPACERKILPEFPQFKSINWVELTDKAEMIRAIKKAIILKYASMPTLPDNSEYDIRDQTRYINSNEIKMYILKIDFNGDGIEDRIYKSEWEYPYGKNNNTCTKANYYYLDTSKINLDNAKEIGGGPFSAFNAGADDQLFMVNNIFYSSNWLGAPLNSQYNLEVYMSGNTRVCSVLVK